ncbi:hypothetical protein EDC94DRAFT_641096 [Helicostylum pulchrum]|nr:hypothetical protein EDC94DRAFT_641096 [Helicostylum pulchrum]
MITSSKKDSSLVIFSCSQIKLSIAKKEMPVTDTLDISKIKPRTLLSMYDTDYKFQKDSIYYDVKARPANHLKAFFKLQQPCEHAKKLKKNICFPIRPNKYLRFQDTLETDGIGVSVLKQNSSTNRRLADTGRQQSVTKDEYKIEHIQGLTQEALNRTTDNCVLIDPGRRDSITVKEKKTFIFTKNNRTKLSKHFRYLRKRSQPFTIKATEAAHFETDPSSISVDKFVQYIKTRASTIKSDKCNLYYESLFLANIRDLSSPRNQRYILQKLQLLPFRKIKFSTKLYYNQNGLEVVNGLKTKFGPNAVLILGDWSAPNVPHQESTRKKGLIKMLKKNGFVVYLINGFRTSSLCPFCEASLQTFKTVPNPRPYKRTSAPTVTCHGLLR